MSSKKRDTTRQAAKTPADPPNMTIQDVAEYLGTTTKTVYNMVADGRLRAYTLGYRIVRFRRSDVDAALTPTDAVRV